MYRLITKMLFEVAKSNWKSAIKERDKINKVVEKQRQKMIKYSAEL